MTNKYVLRSEVVTAGIAASYAGYPEPIRNAALAIAYFKARRAWQEFRGTDRFKTRYTMPDPVASKIRRNLARQHIERARALGFRGSVKAALATLKQAA